MDGDAAQTSGWRVREARPVDAFAIAALHIQHERELGHAVPVGFLDEFAQAWLRDTARRTWLAEDPRGRPLGVLHGTRVQRLPSAHRPADAWFHVSLLFVSIGARGSGIGEGLLDAMLAWAESDGVSRVQLHALPGVRAIYQRFGFGPPSQQLMERQISRRGG
ncbi:MAG TPA: GNAT family N-acetyltransferase [Ornithinibacter sp.]|jgi:GNAT superfamily N-acetyltransferase|nr:GNAT family N-acetyltransferase [Ornithinibacter sp.]HQA12652.1 GNAT family N-acetyltransferase [Ornithinibacter sp.]HQD67307.1 GNAT family N-acetyltransferase [Ornithinibacter sp.]HQX87073.1 GNAT family N-acetyltransferase [Ornithinibacter sp.]